MPASGLGGAGGELLLLVLLSAFMAWSMVRNPGQPFFRPVVLAFVPVLVFLAMLVAQGDWMDGPVEDALMAGFNESVEELEPPRGMDPEVFREELKKSGRAMLALMPGITAAFWLGLLTLSVVDAAR